MRKINTDLPEFIWAHSITALIDKIDETKEDAEIAWSSFGGSTYAGQTFADFLNNKEYKLDANVTGIAASMGAALLPFFDKVRGAKQADIMVHSATGGAKSTLKNTNTFLYEALAKKIDTVKFKEITGKDLKTIMLAEDDDRTDVWLTGEQAGEVGLFDETYDLLDKAASLKDKIDLEQLDYQLPEGIATKYGLKEKKQNQINNNDMDLKDVTVEALSKENSTVYNSIVDEAKTAEQQRVSRVMKYAKYDLEKANEIINSGKDLTTEDVEHFMEKKFNKTKLDELEEGSEAGLAPGKTTKNQAEETVEEKEKKEAIGDVREILGTSDLMEEKSEK